MSKLFSRARAVVNRPRVQHYIEIFVAATGSALFYQRDQILGAHGLDAVGCLVFGACVVGVKAAMESYRKGFEFPQPPASK
jgi:hypothetical protein